MARTKNLARLRNDRTSIRLEDGDRDFLLDWAEKQAAKAGVEFEAIGLSGAIRAAIKAFRFGASQDAGFRAGHAQGITASIAKGKRGFETALSGALAGLDSAEESKK